MNKKQKEYCIKEGWIIDDRGRKFIRFGGLLHLAHEKGLATQKTEPILLDHENKFYIYKATVTTADGGHFEATGDASPRNTSRMMHDNLIRMAETRALCRALRFLTGTGLTSYEELPGEAEKTSPETPTKTTRKKKPPLMVGRAVDPGNSKKKSIFDPMKYRRIVDLLRINTIADDPLAAMDELNFSPSWRTWTKNKCDKFVDTIQSGRGRDLLGDKYDLIFRDHLEPID